ncbi:transcriptional repressor LexA [Vallitaleaceae bacterium 9-2]
MADTLSDKQRRILDFIRNEQLNKGYPPSVREICEAVGLKSTSTVHGHLERLEKKGYIRRDPTKPRAIEIMEDGFTPIRHEMINIPIVGKVAAGEPLLAIEHIEDYFPIPADYISGNDENLFMVQVQGDSMINAGIFNDDMLIVRQQEVADNRDIVVALLDDSVTVKTFYKEKNIIRLQPENDSMAPIYVHDVKILGKVVGLYRNY